MYRGVFMEERVCMAKLWDETMKKAVAASPQAFVDWLCPGGQFVELMNTELPKKTEEPLRCDICLSMALDDLPCILHLEMQSTADAEMAERTLEYALRIKRQDQKHRPVYSCVIYLRPVGEVQQPPLRWQFPNRREHLRYDYGSIALADLDPAVLLESHRAGLLTLLPLTRDGASHTMTETMLAELRAAERIDLIPIATMLASLAFGIENSVEQEWLTRKVNEMYDTLQETPIYKLFTKDAREEGRQEGREALRRAIVEIVRKRFPKMAKLAKKQVADVDDPERLSQLVVDISTAQTAE